MPRLPAPNRPRSGAGRMGGFHGGLVVGQDPGFLQQVDVGAQVSDDRRFIAQPGSKTLLDLRGAAVAVHVAKAADVHEDVEAQGGAGMEGAESFVVLPRWRRPSSMISSTAGGWELRDDVPDLAVGMVAGPVDAGWRRVRLQGFRCARRGRLGARPRSEFPSRSSRRGLFQHGAGLDQVLVGLGVFDQRGRGADFAREQGGGFGGQTPGAPATPISLPSPSIARPGSTTTRGDSDSRFSPSTTPAYGTLAAFSNSSSFFDEGGAGFGVDVPGRAGGGVAQLFAQVADLGHGMGEQPRDLGFQGAGVDDLARGTCWWRAASR